MVPGAAVQGQRPTDEAHRRRSPGCEDRVDAAAAARGASAPARRGLPRRPAIARSAPGHGGRSRRAAVAAPGRPAAARRAYATSSGPRAWWRASVGRGRRRPAPGAPPARGSWRCGPARQDPAPARARQAQPHHHEQRPRAQHRRQAGEQQRQHHGPGRPRHGSPAPPCRVLLPGHAERRAHRAEGRDLRQEQPRALDPPPHHDREPVTVTAIAVHHARYVLMGPRSALPAVPRQSHGSGPRGTFAPAQVAVGRAQAGHPSMGDVMGTRATPYPVRVEAQLDPD